MLAASIQDVPENRTRFVVVRRRADPASPTAPAPGVRYRTTLAFGVRNAPGTLLAALQVFAERGINLSKLESRPNRSAAWEYVFWTDLDAHAEETACQTALTELRRVAALVRTFGSYHRVAD